VIVLARLEMHFQAGLRCPGGEHGHVDGGVGGGAEEEEEEGGEARHDDDEDDGREEEGDWKIVGAPCLCLCLCPAGEEGTCLTCRGLVFCAVCAMWCGRLDCWVGWWLRKWPLLSSTTWG